MAEKEYIEREALIDNLKKSGAICGFGKHLIRNYPAADVVSVVRCKDCTHRPLCCRIIRAEGNRPDDFCSYGEKIK